MTTPIASVNSITDRDYLLEFVSRFEQLSGKTYRCSAGNEASTLIQKLIAEKGQGKCYFTKEVLAFIQSKDNAGHPHPLSSADLYDPKENTNGLDILEQADIGITTAKFAVAETGCLVEVSYEDSSKLLSSLSRVNIVLLRASSILSTLQELAPILRGLLSKKDKPTVTLISGPSRTSDIEMKSVLGVHGPHEVYAIIVE
ncbi:MAG: lactate utilization protein [archaeon]|nr:lactate utilization protein [archaeon]